MLFQVILCKLVFSKETSQWIFIGALFISMLGDVTV
jgi:hypothetical protein